MSDIYVKWMRLKGISGSFKSYSDSLNRIAEQADSVKSRLKLSDDVSYSIKNCISKDAGKLRSLSANMRNYSNVLTEISEMYSTTENNNIDR